MKYENCPSCNGKLGIPEKRLGHPVTCPTCKDVFLPELNSDSEKSAQVNDKKRKKRKSKSRKSAKSEVRSLPLPAAMSVDLKSKVSDEVSEFDPPESPGATSTLNTPAPKRRSRSSTAFGDATDELIADALHADRKPLDPVRQEVDDENESDSNESDNVASSTQTPATARIIKSESVKPQMLEDGSLPKLQLKDEQKGKAPEFEFKTSPLFIGALLCVSLVSSGLMMVFADFGNPRGETTHGEARIAIQKFYEVRRDNPIKPFQMELREAQRAHSRGDRSEEIKAYRKVMARFRAEDRNRFVGVTGLPSADKELEHLVSILLNDPE